MPSTIVTTISSASANSYVSLSDATTYFADRFGGEAWSGNGVGDDESKQTQALLTAARRMQEENWLGSRIDTTQALAWPRSGVEKPDGPYRSLYLTTEIPQPVKDAQCELALWLMATNQRPGEANRRVKTWSADGASATFEYQGTIQTMPSEYVSLVTPLIAGPRIRRG